MSEATRARLDDAVTAFLAGDVDRSELEMCALAHLDSEPGYDTVRAAYEADPGPAASAALNSHRMASRVLDGRPVTATVGS